MNKKGKKFFNILIMIVIIIALCLIGFVSYYYISNYIMTKEAEDTVDIFEEQVSNIQEEVPVQEEQNTTQNITQNPTTTNNRKPTIKYKNYTVIGTIQIPKTKVRVPIVDKVTTSSIASSAAVLYGPGLNKTGNTVIIAHNYRNGTFFSNNKKLVVGDKVYITDLSGKKIEYSIYKTYITGENDFSYATRDTNGKKEISLSTCTTDATKRLVIWAKET